MNYYELLRKYISESGMTLNEIGDSLKEYGFSITKSYISKLQNGKTDRPATDELNRALAKVTGGDVDQLLSAALIERAPVEIKEKFYRLSKLKELNEEYNFIVKENAPDGIYCTSEDKFIDVPLLGSIAAGQPIDRIEYIEGYERVNRDTVRGREVFALRVKGDSMIGDHIYDGDIVIVAMQKEVMPTDIAVVAVNGDTATLKRVKIHNDVCVLTPSNPNMEPLLLPLKDVEIIGKAIEVRSKLE